MCKQDIYVLLLLIILYEPGGQQVMFFTTEKTQLVQQNESKNLNVNNETHFGCLLREVFCICNEFSTYLVFLLLPINHFALQNHKLVFQPLKKRTWRCQAGFDHAPGSNTIEGCPNRISANAPRRQAQRPSRPRPQIPRGPSGPDDPCFPSPCGTNADCRSTGNRAVGLITSQKDKT